MNHQRVAGVVVRRVPFKESDLIVTLITEEMGKISAIARGARKSKKRFGATLDNFAHSTFELSEHRKGDLHNLLSAQTLDIYAKLNFDLASVAHAGYVTEITRELLPQEFPEPEIYRLLAHFLNTLDAEGATSLRLRKFEMRLLDTLGFLPSFDNCQNCGALLGAAIVSAAENVVVCKTCGLERSLPDALKLSSEEIDFLRLLRSTEDLQVPKTEKNQGDGSHFRQLFYKIITSHLSKPLKSIEFLAKLRTGLQN